MFDNFSCLPNLLRLLKLRLAFKLSTNLSQRSRAGPRDASTKFDWIHYAYFFNRDYIFMDILPNCDGN